MELKELRAEYERIAGKHKLPGFVELNNHFDIDRIDTESLCLLREVRRVMMEKMIGYMRLIEMLLNPSAGPPIFMQFSRNIDSDERKALNDLYKSFAEIEVEAINLDLSYNEGKEAEHVVKVLSVWKNAEKDMRKATAMMLRNLGSEKIVREKNYFG